MKKINEKLMDFVKINELKTVVSGIVANTKIKLDEKLDFDEVDAIITDKINGLEKYVHPETHPATMIVQDSTHRFVTDAEKIGWNDKYTKGEIDNLASSLTEALVWKQPVETFEELNSKYDKPSLGWTAYVEVEDAKYTWNGTEWVQTSNGDIPMATAEVDGKMSKENYVKLAGIESGANKYTHPANHPASIITQDASNRFVTDTEKADWNAKLGATDNAVSATKLQTARTINGTAFDGTSNITTANWGTARNLTIGSSTKSVNGSENITWSLNEMGAIAEDDIVTATEAEMSAMFNEVWTEVWGVAPVNQ